MTGNGNSTLIINAGSSSVKFRLYLNSAIAVDGVVDAIGKNARLSFVKNKVYQEMQGVRVQARNYTEAANEIINVLENFVALKKIKSVVYRVVHGGLYSEPQRITPSVLKELEKFAPLAPLHQPQSMTLIRFFMQQLKARHIACFDTMFHAKMPALANTYAIPRALAQKYKIMRYGFHGLSHASLLRAAEQYAGKKYQKVITCQLGNGISLCAIRNGKSVDTTMGFTPLEGLPMGTRSGSIDPAIIPFLCKHEKKTPRQVLSLLEHESGLKALSGFSDIRDLLAGEKRGDARCKFALDFFAYHIRKQIGAYVAALNGLDCLILGGGISRAPKMRQRILSGLETLGIVLNQKVLSHESPVCISKGKVAIWIVETDEQGYMYEITKGLREV